MEHKEPTANRPPGQPARPAGKPAAKAPPGDGLLGWFGRQVGHVTKAVQADVTQRPAKGPGKPAEAKTKPARSAKPQAARPAAPPPPKQPAGAKQASSKQPSPKPPPAAAAPASAVEKVIYREDKVEEAELPDRPGVILRRTIIDEVVVEAETTVQRPSASQAE